MKNKFWTLLLCLHCLALSVAAQNPAKRQLVLPVSNGGFVAFRSETSAPETTLTPNGKALAALLYSQAFAGENRVIHRVLTDAERHVVFAYNIWVNADPISKKFSLTILPADEAFRRSFLKDFAPLRTNETLATFPKSTTPQTLDDGDAVSLELLVNQESGVKIIDVVTLTFDRSRLRDYHLDSAPKDFTLDAIALAVKNSSLSINGTLVRKSKSSGCTGALLWFYLPERGRFIFSLVPREGYEFEKIAVLDGNKIEFTADGERYEWVSVASILPSGGTWNLWVLRDADYTPLFGSGDSLPKAAKRPNLLEKIDGALMRHGATLTFPTTQTRKRDEKSPVVVPQLVMIGGADSMENLLPKGP
jgi:hypothetical protein